MLMTYSIAIVLTSDSFYYKMLSVLIRPEEIVFAPMMR